MSINKNALLRYNVLDKCFQNFGRKYYFENLLNTVNTALLEDNPNSSGIQKRQLREDIRFMKSESGYAAPIVTYLDGKKGYYRYENKDFSINKSPLNATEAEQLKNAISILGRFEGSPQFEWVSELGPLLNDQFDLKETGKKVMSYDANIDYTGYHYITTLFNAIINKRVLSINYEPFGKESIKVIFHPYYLKQFNNRWFVFGRNEDYNVNTWNFALDRITNLQEVDKPYLEDKTDWEDFFYDIIGVTKLPNQELEEITLLFSKEQAPYIYTKPLHPSQKATYLNNGQLSVRIQVIINYELEMRLLSYGEKVKVINPESLRLRLLERLKKAVDQY